MSRRLSYISFTAAYLIVVWIVFFARPEAPTFVETVSTLPTSSAAVNTGLPAR